MGIKRYKPTSPGRRGMCGSTFEEMTKFTPEKSLLEPQAQHRRAQQLRAGITARHRGGGAYHHYRMIDFKRNKHGVPAQVRRHRVRSEPLGAHRAAAV